MWATGSWSELFREVYNLAPAVLLLFETWQNVMHLTIKMGDFNANFKANKQTCFIISFKSFIRQKTAHRMSSHHLLPSQIFRWFQITCPSPLLVRRKSKLSCWCNVNHPLPLTSKTNKLCLMFCVMFYFTAIEPIYQKETPLIREWKLVMYTR